MTDIRARLDRFPRVQLGHWPTPLEPCRQLQAQIGGPLVWLKRDDCSGLAFGGNKTRKLEFLLGEATLRGASGVVTFGALQSNHARQTAAAAARVGLPCDLVLTDAVDRPTVSYRSSGNRLLDDVLGANVHVVADNDAARALAVDLAEADGDRYFIEPGGSSPTGALAYVGGAEELATQLADLAIVPEAVYVASSTGGTAAGLVVGLDLAEVDTTVVAVAVYAEADHTATVVERLIDGTVDRLGVDLPERCVWTVDGAALGDGYGIETAESHAAILTLARAEGVLLDPVYTAKSFASLLTALPDMEQDADVVFLHTGGQPGLFAYSDAFS